VVVTELSLARGSSSSRGSSSLIFGHYSLLWGSSWQCGMSSFITGHIASYLGAFLHCWAHCLLPGCIPSGLGAFHPLWDRLTYVGRIPSIEARDITCWAHFLHRWNIFPVVGRISSLVEAGTCDVGRVSSFRARFVEVGHKQEVLGAYSLH
jgi:hypothetical protein